MSVEGMGAMQRSRPRSLILGLRPVWEGVMERMTGECCDPVAERRLGNTRGSDGRSQLRVRPNTLLAGVVQKLGRRARRGAAENSPARGRGRQGLTSSNLVRARRSRHREATKAKDGNENR